MRIRLFEDNPQDRDIRKIVEMLENGGIIIYPTDTIYAFGCAINQKKAMQKMAQLKGVKFEKARFSVMCHDLSMLSGYVKMSNEVFREMKRVLPGPFTFVLPATNKIPNLLLQNRKNIGIRIPANDIARHISETLGMPLLTTSVKGDEEIESEYITDPELIHERFGDKVDVVVDGGPGHNTPSTIVDCTGDELTIVRQGLGIL